MNPRDLENRFLKLLEENNFIAQKSLFSIKHLPNGRVLSNRSDFFGVWDLIAMNRDISVAWFDKDYHFHAQDMAHVPQGLASMLIDRGIGRPVNI